MDDFDVGNIDLGGVLVDTNKSYKSEKNVFLVVINLEIKDVLHVAERLVETGVTSFCPTMVSSSPRTYRRIISLMRSAREQQQQQDQTTTKLGN